MIPNTTPTPNELYNGEMKKMSDPELRVVMIVTRATFGWIIDETTGMRKEEDWISHSQMVERTGKSSRAISYAIASCIKNNWIQARSEDGKILRTATDRKLYGKKIFYRLGSVFLTRARTIANGAMVGEPSQMVQATIANGAGEPSHHVRTTKETLTKEIITKEKNTPQSGEGLKRNKLIEEYYRLKGWTYESTPAAQKLFRRHLRPAKELLELCDGDLEEAKDCVQRICVWATTRSLDWSMETVFKKWYDLDFLKPKEKKPYYEGKRIFQKTEGGRWWCVSRDGEIRELGLWPKKEEILYK